jgi:hypothetical protein
MADLPVFPVALLISLLWGVQPIIHKTLLNTQNDPQVLFCWRTTSSGPTRRPRECRRV